MNQIELRITELVQWVRAEGAYCCRLEGVMEIGEKPTTVRVTMRCLHHDTYSFELYYGGPEGEPHEKDDSVLMRRIALGIIKEH